MCYASQKRISRFVLSNQLVRVSIRRHRGLPTQWPRPEHYYRVHWSLGFLDFETIHATVAQQKLFSHTKTHTIYDKMKPEKVGNYMRNPSLYLACANINTIINAKREALSTSYGVWLFSICLIRRISESSAVSLRASCSGTAASTSY